MKKVEEGSILFFSPSKKNGCFSNFYKCPKLIIDSIPYKTSEHYYQSKKFEGTPYEVQVRDAKTPFQAKKIASDRKLPLRSDWEKVKEDVMYKVCYEKFKQNPKIKKKLMETGNKKLVEHSSKDKYWADGGNGSGKNRLGFVLEKVRSAFKKPNKKK